MCGPQIRLCLFTFWPIASKQFNSSTTIDSGLGGAVVTHPLCVQEVPGSIPGFDKGFYVWVFVLFFICFYFLSKNSFVTKFCNSFGNVYLFSILNILQDLWPIIRV